MLRRDNDRSRITYAYSTWKVYFGLRIVAEALHLRHNLSAILRSAESFGVHDVHPHTSLRAKASSAERS